MGFAVPSRSDQRERPARFQLIVPTDLGQVGAAVDAVLESCTACSEVSGAMRFRLCTVVAEAVANAIAYGNRNDPSRHVMIEVDCRPDEVLIGVTDQGDGFDPAAVPDPLGPECQDATCGRGLFMIRHLTSQVVFNARGNTIWMTLPRR